MLFLNDLFMPSFGSSPASEPGGVGRASIRAAGFALKNSIMLAQAGSFKVVVLV